MLQINSKPKAWDHGSSHKQVGSTKVRQFAPQLSANVGAQQDSGRQRTWKRSNYSLISLSEPLQITPKFHKQEEICHQIEEAEALSDVEAVVKSISGKRRESSQWQNEKEDQWRCNIQVDIQPSSTVSLLWIAQSRRSEETELCHLLHWLIRKQFILSHYVA